MGKNKHLIHKCFRQITCKEGNKTVTKSICSYCNWGTITNATRQKKHISMCVKCPLAIKKNILHLKNNSIPSKLPT